MDKKDIKVSSIILLAETRNKRQFLFGAYDDNGNATGFLDLPEDHEKFVETLKGQQTIMGRKTLEATPEDFPDGGRICITHHTDDLTKGAVGAKTIEEAIDIAKERAVKAGQDRVYIIGGASIIEQAIAKEVLQEIQLTLAYDHQKEVSNPVYLNFKMPKWDAVEYSNLKVSENSNPKNIRYKYFTLTPKKRRYV